MEGPIEINNTGDRKDEPWICIYRAAVAGWSHHAVGKATGKTPNTARNWWSGATLPDARSWRAIVVVVGLTGRWAELSAARDAAAATRKKPGAKREDPAAVLRRRIGKLQAQLDALEVDNA